jgi:hypothetical protein
VVSDKDPHSIYLRLLAEKADEELKRYDLASNGGLQPKALRAGQGAANAGKGKRPGQDG